MRCTTPPPPSPIFLSPAAPSSSLLPDPTPPTPLLSNPLLWQDEDDRKLAMEALGKGVPDADTGGAAVGGRRRYREGDRKEAAAAKAAAEKAVSKSECFIYRGMTRGERKGSRRLLTRIMDGRSFESIRPSHPYNLLGFHRPGRHCLHYSSARSARGWWFAWKVG